MNRMHLQGIGSCPAKPASEIKVGDRLMWNYGYVYEVVDVQPCGAKSVTVSERSEKTGEVFTRRLLGSRLVVTA